MIRIENLDFAYGANTILASVNLSVQAGDCLIVMGGNGSGKSTLLKCIFGIEHPRRGRVLLHGSDITGVPLSKRRGLGVSYLFQGRRIFDLLTVRQNISLALGSSGAASIARSMSLLSSLSAGSISADQLGSELSGGQARILAIVCAVACEAGVLLLDEPSENLSSAASEMLWDYLNERLSKKDLCILLVTHSVTEAKRVGNSFCRVENSSIFGPVDNYDSLLAISS